jgi:hypothetical protein
LTTSIAGGHGEAAIDEFGAAKYGNIRKHVSSSDHAFQEIGQMAERLNLSQSIIDHANISFRVGKYIFLLLECL